MTNVVNTMRTDLYSFISRYHHKPCYILTPQKFYNTFKYTRKDIVDAYQMRGISEVFLFIRISISMCFEFENVISLETPPIFLCMVNAVISTMFMLSEHFLFFFVCVCGGGNKHQNWIPLFWCALLMLCLWLTISPALCST